MTAVCPAGHTSQADDYCDVCGMPIDASAPPAAAPGPPPAPDAPADAAAGVTAADGAQPCPHCGAPNAAEALFCENCGYDFTTGSMPRPAEPEPLESPDAGSAAPGAEAGGAADASGGGDAAAPATEDAGASTAPEAPTGSAPVTPEEFDWVVELWIDPAWYDAQDSPDQLPSPGLPEVLPLRQQSILIGRRSVSRNINPEIDCGSDSGVSRRQAQLTTDGRRWFVEDLDSANGTFVGSASGALPGDPIAVGTKYELDADDRIYVGAWTRLVIREATEDEKSSLG